MVGVVGSKPIAPTSFSPLRFRRLHRSFVLALRRLALFLAVLLLMPGGIAGAQLLRPLEPPADGIVKYFVAPPLEEAAAA